MSVQVVAAKMAEVELKDVPSKEITPESPLIPKAGEKGLVENEPNAVVTSVTTPTTEPTVKAGDPSPGFLTTNPIKMPQASAMKRIDPQQNGGEAFVNRDGTVAEAPRLKKVSGRTHTYSQMGYSVIQCSFVCYVANIASQHLELDLALCDDGCTV
ncbi:hypothetical protein UPYG_G00344970 [Umbra pygmaea]|uniref:Uncharacterized protein n=1 Tax=Umbra pygmaea TaxID=75934 RepID=A0ABD0VXJ6_UMBPY